MKKLVLAANDAQQQHFASQFSAGAPYCQWVASAAEFVQYPDADAYVDFLFDGSFYSPAHKPLLIAETILSFADMPAAPDRVARFCGWETFWQRPVWEVAVNNRFEPWQPELWQSLGINLQPVSDTPGLIAPRILAAIVNEACYALEEKVAEAGAIDTAMQLGTNYPRGPVDWARQIGVEKLHALLSRLALQSARYTPHPLLMHLAADGIYTNH